MHHDDSIQTVSLADRRVLVVRCDESGRCSTPELLAAWDAAAASFLWLSTDGSPPPASAVVGARDDTVAATLGPVTDAVKRVAPDDVITQTVDRSTLREVGPPALLPAPVVEAALVETARVDGAPATLLDRAVRLAGVVELRPVA